MAQKTMKRIKSISRLAAGLLASLFIVSAASAAQDCVRPAGGKALTPKSVQFDLNSVEISEADRAQLEEMAARFAGNPNIEVCLIGMTDRSGNEDYNKKLALERAEAVAVVLKEHGLADNKYQMVARGQAYTDESWLGKLIGTDPSESNRRVDVILMER